MFVLDMLSTYKVMVDYVRHQGEVVFEAEGECGRHCPIRLSETGETLQHKTFFF